MNYKAYKYRIYPTKEQEELIAKHIGCSRYIYNYALAKKLKSYQETQKSLSRFDIQKELPLLKKQEQTQWLKEVNSQSLQASLENLDKAFTKFFKDKTGFPKFKSKKDSRQSFSIPQSTTVCFERNMIFIPKFKSGIKAKLHRPFFGVVKTSTISRSATGKYYISVLVAIESETPKKHPISENKAIGIDLGIKTFATLSDGHVIENPKHLRRSILKLKRLQKAVSRKKKGSSNRTKAVRKLAIMHEQVFNRRNDFLHKTTHYLTSQYETLCLETLSSKNMMKNHCLAQALSDIAIGKFNKYLEYKAFEKGVNILRIGRFEPSSKMCSCGTIKKDLKLSHRVWTCSVCGMTHDRDLLASNNIKRFAFCKNNTVGATEIQACGDMHLIGGSANEAHG